MVDPSNVFAMDDIHFMTGLNIEPVVASESSIVEAIDRAYSTSEEEETEQVMYSMNEVGEASDIEVQAEKQELEQLKELEKAADEAPIVRLVNLVLTDAVKRGASDIHFEPHQRKFEVLFRIDGSLQSIMSPPLKLRKVITARLKIMANLDISQKRSAQAGRLTLKAVVGGKKKQFSFRVSTLSTPWGERIVLQLSNAQNVRRLKGIQVSEATENIRGDEVSTNSGPIEKRKRLIEGLLLLGVIVSGLLLLPIVISVANRIPLAGALTIELIYHGGFLLFGALIVLLTRKLIYDVDAGSKFLLGFLFVILYFGFSALVHYRRQVVLSEDKFYLAVGLFFTMAAGMLVQVISSNYKRDARLLEVTPSQLVYPLLFSPIVYYGIWAVASTSSAGMFSFYAAFLNGYFWESVVSSAQTSRKFHP